VTPYGEASVTLEPARGHQTLQVREPGDPPMCTSWCDHSRVGERRAQRCEPENGFLFGAPIGSNQSRVDKYEYPALVSDLSWQLIDAINPLRVRS
jgi:hypothetical protein